MTRRLKTMLPLLTSNPLAFLIYLLALLIAISVHEFSHAKVADYLGDPTPRLQGRLTLNPLVHIDPLGILLLFLVGFGWGKPVMFDPFNLKNPRKDAALISIAGPGSNFVVALLLSLLLKLFIFLGQSILVAIGYSVLVPVIFLNIVLGVFNFIPIHPLDGFKIVGGLLSDDKAQEWYQLERYGLLFLIILLLPIGQGNMLFFIIRPLINFFVSLFLPGGLAPAGIL